MRTGIFCSPVTLPPAKLHQDIFRVKPHQHEPLTEFRMTRRQWKLLGTPPAIPFRGTFCDSFTTSERIQRLTLRLPRQPVRTTGLQIKNHSTLNSTSQRNAPTACSPTQSHAKINRHLIRLETKYATPQNLGTLIFTTISDPRPTHHSNHPLHTRCTQPHRCHPPTWKCELFRHRPICRNSGTMHR